MIQITTEAAFILLLTVILGCAIVATLILFSYFKSKGAKGFVDFRTWHIMRHKFLLCALQELMNDYNMENSIKNVGDLPIKLLYTWAQLRTLENNRVDHQTITWKGK